MTEAEYIQKVCENIRLKRIEMKLKQVDLAYSVGIEATNLRRIESGKTFPTFRTICRIASAMKVDVIELIPAGRPDCF